MVSKRDFATPPTFRPLPYRLMGAADGPHPLTGHQKLGVYYQPDDCSLPLETTSDCLTGTGAAKVATAGANWQGTDPFPVYTWLPCDLVGIGEPNALEALRSRTRRAHDNNVQRLVEEIFWTGGTYGYGQHLDAGTPVTETSGGSVVNLQTAASVVATGSHDVTNAISLIEDAMAGCYGGVPLIHVPRALTAYLDQQHLITKQGEFLKTGNGSIVIPGPGYPGTGPDGAAPTAGNTWIFATGQVKLWASEPFFTAQNAAEVLRHDLNSTVLILEQWFMLGWDCCHFAIQVEIPNTA